VVTTLRNEFSILLPRDDEEAEQLMAVALTVLKESRLLLKIEVLLSFWLPALVGQPFQVAVWAYTMSSFMTQLLFLLVMLKALRSLSSGEV